MLIQFGGLKLSKIISTSLWHTQFKNSKLKSNYSVYLFQVFLSQFHWSIKVLWFSKCFLWILRIARLYCLQKKFSNLFNVFQSVCQVVDSIKSSWTAWSDHSGDHQQSVSSNDLIGVLVNCWTNNVDSTDNFRTSIYINFPSSSNSIRTQLEFIQFN